MSNTTYDVSYESIVFPRSCLVSF